MRSLGTAVSGSQVRLFDHLDRLSLLRTSIDITLSAHARKPVGNRFAMTATPVRRVVGGRVIRPGEDGWNA